MNVFTELRCRIADWRMRREMLRVLFSGETDREPQDETPEEEEHEENAPD